MNNNTILVLGASDNPNRPSFSAIKLLINRGLNLYMVNPAKEDIQHSSCSHEISKPSKADIVTIFLNAKKQKKYYDYILSLKPKKIIFNPGTENPELELLAQKKQIQVVKSCTIAMLVNGLW